MANPVLVPMTETTKPCYCHCHVCKQGCPCAVAGGCCPPACPNAEAAKECEHDLVFPPGSGNAVCSTCGVTCVCRSERRHEAWCNAGKSAPAEAPKASAIISDSLAARAMKRRKPTPAPVEKTGVDFEVADGTAKEWAGLSDPRGHLSGCYLALRAEVERLETQLRTERASRWNPSSDDPEGRRS